MTRQMAFLYMIISLLCAVGIGAFLYNVHRYAVKSVSGLFFKVSMICAVVFSLMDVFYALREGAIVPFNEIFAYFTEIVYSIASFWAGYTWFLCSEAEQNSFLVKNRTRRILVSIPVMVMVLFSLTTPLHHLAFSFDGSTYVRGPVTMPFTMVSVVLIEYSGIKALVLSFRKKNYLKRRFYRTLFCYSFITILFQLIQASVGSIAPFRPLSALLVFYIVQDTMMKSKVYKDVATGVNNRAAIDDFFRSTFDRTDEHSYLIMFDVDNFKFINDKYGHSMGDKALKLMATALKESVPRNFFIARYGGDEFIVAGKTMKPGDDEQIETMITCVRTRLTQLAERNGLPFTPEFSAGYKNRTADMETIPDMVNAADEAMYRRKTERKANRQTAPR